MVNKVFFFLSIISNYKSTKRVRFARNAYYPYLTNPKNLENMIRMNEKYEIEFNQLNGINFWLIRFILIKTKEIFKEKYFGWIKDDLNNYLYKYSCTCTLIIILKYNILNIKIS